MSIINIKGRFRVDIKIQALGIRWINFDSGEHIGTGSQLIEYVNKNKYHVANENSFLDCKAFWYNNECHFQFSECTGQALELVSSGRSEKCCPSCLKKANTLK